MQRPLIRPTPAQDIRSRWQTTAIPCGVAAAIVCISFICFTTTFADPPAATVPTTKPARHRHPCIYVPPPPNGAPYNVTGGAARGRSDLPMPQLCVPFEHMGLAATAQPTLYFYVPQTTPNKVAVTLMDTETKETISLPLIDGIKQKGLQRFDVAATGHSLRPGIPYVWSVAIRATDGGPAHNAYAGAFIRYDEPSPEMTAALIGKDAEDKAVIFADNHFWFDTIAAEIDSINAEPDDDSLRDQLRQTLTDNKCSVDTDSIPRTPK